MPKRSKKEGEGPNVVAAEDDDLHIPAQLESSDGESEDELQAAENGLEDSEDGSLQSDEEDFREALTDYVAAAAANGDPNSRAAEAAGPGVAEHDEEDEQHVDPGSDSSEDEDRPNRNTVGSIPLKWYQDEDHIGYNVEGKKLLRKARGDKLDALLARNDSSKALHTIYDEYNDEEITLTKEELNMVLRIRKGQFPHVDVNPYEPYVDWFTREQEVTPLINAPEPKRRFIPSKWEEKKIVKLVRAMRKGWLKTEKERKKAREPPVYLLWAEDDAGADKTGSGLTYIPAAKLKLPGHEESYNPPKEYLPTEEERAGYELLDEADRPKFVPQSFDSLRHVPMYADFIKERFERCLDLYLCPRVRKKRLHIDPQTLVPKLPKPQELLPFPTTLAIRYSGHRGKVCCVAPHPGGQWLATGSADGTVKLWEVSTGRCCNTWHLGSSSSRKDPGDAAAAAGRKSSSSSNSVSAVLSVAWCPNPALQLLAAVVDQRVVLLPSGLGGEEVAAAAVQALQVPSSTSSSSSSELATWSPGPDGGVELVTKHPVRQVTWHARGDYFASVAPTGGTQAVLVHQLSKRTSQNPFRKNRGRVMRVAFHPSKPFFFVATQNHVRVYNLAKQALAKQLIGGSGTISCLAVHPSGDHVLVGSEDKRLAWYDMDLSTKPYKALRYHSYAVRGAAYHPSYPLFASSSDDGTIQVFHGRVFADLMTNPLIVPVKILRGHEVVDYAGVLDVAFHPTQPWLFSGGADGDACLFCN